MIPETHISMWEIDRKKETEMAGSCQAQKIFGIGYSRALRSAILRKASFLGYVIGVSRLVALPSTA